ncbi:hypothetical protein EDD18DRAFT_1117352 [Armillaria luteobubalina]|uniref:Uncharacterized protein n=1 Tax=Armillaria luteobubalina TaxID=153913 RepID=A0AA39NX85_9AGAR|nr:hypothetical protein EDD18DRAFT_1117352 [Armillaria luteobubalina]
MCILRTPRQEPLDIDPLLSEKGGSIPTQDSATTGNDQCVLKQKSEIEDDEKEYAPGTNSFSLLLKLMEPLAKKMRNSHQEENEDDQEIEKDKDKKQCLSPSPSNTEGVEDYDDYDDEIVEVITCLHTLRVNVPRVTASYAVAIATTLPADPFTQCLPDHLDGDRDVDSSPVTEPGMSTAVPYKAQDQSFLGAPDTQPAPPSSDLALMFAPTSSLNITPAAANKDDGSISIYKEFTGSFEPHSIPPQHVFHNYDLEQINMLFRTQVPGNILIIMWGLEYKDLTYMTEARIEATIKTFFQRENLMLQIAPPSPPPSYKAKGPTLPKAQKFVEDHTGTPFTFYVHKLSPKMKDTLLHEGFLPTTLNSYQVLDASDFITDFIFTIDGIKKIIKDKLYQSLAIRSFLQVHHNAIDPSVPINEIPSLVILSLEAWAIWIEGSKDEKENQAGRPGTSGLHTQPRTIDILFFCKGCKGESHPTMQCPLKVQLGLILKKPYRDGAPRGCSKGKGSWGG